MQTIITLAACLCDKVGDLRVEEWCDACICVRARLCVRMLLSEEVAAYQCVCVCAHVGVSAC